MRSRTQVTDIGPSPRRNAWPELEYVAGDLRRKAVRIERTGETVDADAQSRRGGHSVFQRAQKILVQRHGLLIAALAQFKLILKTLALINRVVQLRKAVRDFLAVANGLEPLHQVAGFFVLVAIR